MKRTRALACFLVWNVQPSCRMMTSFTKRTGRYNSAVAMGFLHNDNNDSDNTSPSITALEQARQLRPPEPAMQSSGEAEGAEWWNEHWDTLRVAWREWQQENEVVSKGAIVPESTNGGEFQQYGHHHHLVRKQLPPLNASFVDPELRSKVYNAWNDPDTYERYVEDSWKEFIPNEVYSIGTLLTESGIVALREHLHAIETSGIPIRRPNGMNRYGMLLDSTVPGGIDDSVDLIQFMDTLVDDFIRPMARLLFPGFVRKYHQDDDANYYAFTIRYNSTEDVELKEHADASVVTLNLNLNLPNETYSGSSLYFVTDSEREGPTIEGHDGRGRDQEVPPQKDGKTSSKSLMKRKVPLHFDPGMALLHRGMTRHAALPIERGQRHNLVIWLYGRDGTVRIAPYPEDEQLSAKERWMSPRDRSSLSSSSIWGVNDMINADLRKSFDDGNRHKQPQQQEYPDLSSKDDSVAVTNNDIHELYSGRQSPKQKQQQQQQHAKSPRRKLLSTNETRMANKDPHHSWLRHSQSKKVEDAGKDQSRRRQGGFGNEDHSIAGLNCQDHGGPNDDQDVIEEMIYWKDYPTDSQFQSPYKEYGPRDKYLTFEPDEGGWNNQRISVETMVVLAISTCRTLVLPPKSRFDYNDLYPFTAIAQETAGLKIISTEEFLIKEGLSGQLHDEQNPHFKLYPPENNRTNWDGDMRFIWDGNPLWLYLRSISYRVIWNRDECVIGIAKEPGPKGVQSLESIGRQLLSDTMNELVRIESYTGNPTPVNATPYERLREILSQRKNLCIYNDKMQNSKVLHFVGDGASSNGRVLAQFYLYVLFEDHKVDLWTKRFVRDHLRYSDEIQCAAARIVQAMRQHARTNDPTNNPHGIYDSFHIRRSDFLGFQPTINVTAEEIVRNSWNILWKANHHVGDGGSSKGEIHKGTLYIASDEYERQWFDPFREHYNIYFLDDFKPLFPTLGGQFWGMLEQLAVSRGRNFFGTYFSTFSAYINRLRAYQYQNNEMIAATDDSSIETRNKRYEQQQGIIPSYYFAPKTMKYAMRQYRSISQPMWAREFPIAWRDIDRDFLS